MRLLKFWKLRVGTYSSWALNRSGGGLISFHNFQLFILLSKVEFWLFEILRKQKYPRNLLVELIPFQSRFSDVFFGQGVVGEWALIRVGCLLNIPACSAGAYALNEINKVVSKTLRRFDRLQLQSIVPLAFSLQHVRHKRPTSSFIVHIWNTDILQLQCNTILARIRDGSLAKVQKNISRKKKTNIYTS